MSFPDVEFLLITEALERIRDGKEVWKIRFLESNLNRGQETWDQLYGSFADAHQIYCYLNSRQTALCPESYIQAEFPQRVGLSDFFLGR